MATDNDHIIHLANGQLSPRSRTTREDVARMVTEAVNRQPAAGLVIHFHGGLVKETAGRAIAQRLLPVYATAGAYPLFFVWESGLLETVRNNLADISQEKIFREFVKKAAEWVFKKAAQRGRLQGRGRGCGGRDQAAPGIRCLVSGSAQHPAGCAGG
jgi:hypothetical protein